MANNSRNFSSIDDDSLLARKELARTSDNDYTSGTKLSAKKREKLVKDIKALEYKLDLENQKKLQEQKKKDDKELSDARAAKLAKEGKILESSAEAVKQKLSEASESLTSNLGTTVKGITDKIDAVIENFISKQQSIAAHLMGTNTTLDDITGTLSSALSGQGLVKQESVYNNLSKLVNEGIVYNVEQRAFLQTLSDDMDLMFNANNGSLTRLIRLQSTDLTSYRMAIQYDLQTFLNQNYSTSEYIKDAFTNVSEALLETQSLLSSSEGIALESTLQTILGSYYSLGGSTSTVNNLAKAINSLGSGDISELGSGISNLILMGVAQAGLDYGDILNGGLNAQETSEIMNNVISYMSSMYSGTESNVVRNQLAKAFGVTVSDLVAAYKTPKVEGGVSADISTLLSDYSGFTHISTQVSNLMDNLIYSWGTGIASSTGQYIGYEASKLISSTLGTVLEGVNIDIPLLGSVNLGKIAQAAPLVALFPSLIENVSAITTGLSGGLGDLNSIYDALLSTSRSTIKVSDAGVSGSLYVGNGNTTDLLNSSLSGVSDLVGNNVAGDQEEDVWKDDVSVIRDTIENIYDKLMDIASNLADRQNYGFYNSYNN